MLEVWDGLLPSECGFVLAVALEGRGEADWCDGLAGDAAGRCRAVLQALDSLPADARGAALSRLGRHALSAIPEGIERFHAGWLRAAFQGERPELVRAVLAGAPRALRDAVLGDSSPGPSEPLSPEAVTELRRAALAGLVPPGGGDEAARLGVLPEPALLAQLRRCGARTLGASLRAAPRQVLECAAACAGDDLGAVVLESAAAEGPVCARDVARAAVAAASLLGCADSVLAAGLVSTAWALQDAGGREAVQQLAQRLPPELGRAMLRAAAASSASR